MGLAQVSRLKGAIGSLIECLREDDMKRNAKLLLFKLSTYSHFCLIRPTPEGRVIGFFVGRDDIVEKAFKHWMVDEGEI